MPALIPTVEARRLAAFLRRTSRPLTDDDKAELIYWLDILTAHPKETHP